MAEKNLNNDSPDNNTEGAEASRVPDLGLGPQRSPPSNPPGHLELDLGLGTQPKLNYPPSTSSSERREEKPFSFKRFLNQDTSNRGGSTSGGVRRKEYSPDGSPVLPPKSTSDHHATLPDFVQDHLLAEQCYMQGNSDSTIGINVADYANLVDVEGMAKSLPDFLSDGVIHTPRQRSDDDNVRVAASASAGQPPVSSSSRDDHHQRLEREVYELRRLLNDRTREIESLERQLHTMQNCDTDADNTSIQIAMCQMEDEIQSLRTELATSENTVKKLKQENSRLRRELSNCGTSTSQQRSDDRLTSDLRNAASAAEVHVRSLLTGIENLRLLADKLDGRTNRPLYDFENDDDGASGPAL